MSDQPAAVNHGDRAHSDLGASKCSRWWHCPGSVALSRDLPDNETEASRKGTAAHEVAQLCLENRQDAIEYVGRAMSNGVVVDAAIADGVEVYLDDCRSLIPEFVLPSDTFIEVQFDLAMFDPPAPMFGTADFVAYSPIMRKLWVKDYKNGYLHVSEDTPQLKYYALGAAAWLGPDRPVNEIEVTICQPNGRAEDIRKITYTALELAEWASDLLRHARATQEPNAPLHAGSWCRFCPARAICPERARYALGEAQAEFGAVVASPDTPGIAPVELRLMTPEQAGAMLARGRVFHERLTALLKDLEVLVAGEINAGHGIPGWKVVEAETRRQFRDETEAAAVLSGIYDIEPWKRELISPAQAEAALADKIPGKTKKARKEAAADALRSLVWKPPGAPKLVSGTDPRPALPTGGSEFVTLPAPSVTE